MQSVHRQNNFDGLRLIAAMMVLVSHQFVLSGYPEPRAVGAFTFGTMGVLIFFSLSGYLIAASWQRDPRLLPFAKKRLLRIWPALAITVLLLSAICIFMQPDRWRYAVEFASNLVFWHHVGVYFLSNKYPMLNGPLWTIPVEVFCYIAFAAIAIITRHRLRWALIGVLLCIGALLVLCTEQQLQSYAEKMGNPTFTPWLCGVFLAASLLQIWPKLKARSPWLIGAGLIAVAFGETSLGLLLAMPPLMISIGEASYPILRRASRFGDLSYGVYLWAWPVQQTGIFLLGKQTPLWQLLLFTIAVTLPLAYASWHLIEKRALRLKTKSTSQTLVVKPVGQS